jgi:demethylmenaquinone methyltransferase/2-methoxy-6-polyprenyl-1,4-benzoquinol methylase
VPWGNGVYGATLIGFSVTLFFAGRLALQKKDIELMKALFRGVIAWLLVEAIFSLAYRVWFNVGVDIALMILFGYPLVKGTTMKEDEPASDERNYYTTQRKFWKILAPFYDIIASPALKVRDTVVDFTNAPKGARVLDIATGTGKQAFAFARKGYDVTGIDLSEAMLKIARRKNKYRNLILQTADASKLPFADSTFDVSCVSFALHEMPLTVRERVLEEMARVTKTKGTVMVIDFGLPENRFGRFFTYNFLRLFEGDHYVKYMKTDLDASIKRAGIAIEGELRILLGGGRIIKGTVIA